MPRDGRDDFDLLLDLIAGDQDESETLTPTARSTLLPLSVPAAATLNFHRTKDNLTTRIPRQRPADENPFEFVMKKTLPDRYLHPQEVNLAGSSSSMDQDTPSEKSQSLQASQRHGVPLFLHPPDPPKPASFTDLRDAVRSSIDKKRRATAALSESLHFAKHEGYKLKDNCDQLNHLANDLHPSSDAPSPPNPRPRRRARFAPGIKPPPPSSLVSKPLPSIPSSFESWTTDGAYPDDDPTLPRSLGPSHNASQEQDELHGVEEKQTSQSAHPMHLSTSTTVSALQRRRDGRTSPPMDEIEFLSGSQARRALRALLAALGLPPIVPDPLILDQHPNEQPPLTPSHMHRALSTDPSSLEDVLRALDFVRFADHVIGGGDQGPEGQKVIFSEDNLKGVVDRLLLWEQAAHST
ncbi:hypothetical protein FRB96_005484 [Tulasnella sp. 330]|nr:hypothetical protein FRB96_005484 [Tulasnella sp. 330]KAG8878479.1 hypothetical protein FRB97_002467 [Tulasnella sp. 331]